MAADVPQTIGDYEILEEIGHGGMGTLYRARDPRIGRDLAIKLLRGNMEDPEMRERFVREARAAGKLKHGNIVTIFELGEQNGMPFIAMEHVQGQTLAALLKQKPMLPLMRKLQMMDQVCAGLHYAHRMGIVHRDIKPANLMIDDEGTMKILDFGIARMGTSKITHTGVVIGTLNYMSPEQMKGQATDPRADIFSFGAVLYELLSYRSPFAGDAPSTVMQKVLFGHPDRLEVICPSLEPSLVAIVARCLEKEPENRYPDLAAVRTALGDVMNDLEARGQEETVVHVLDPSHAQAIEQDRTATRKAEEAARAKLEAELERVKTERTKLAEEAARLARETEVLRARQLEPVRAPSKSAPNDLAKLVALALVAIATLAIATVLIMQSWRSSSQTPPEAAAPAPQATKPQPIEASPAPQPIGVDNGAIERGRAAFIDGRQYDALDRIDQAISSYEIAVRDLANDDPNRQVARDRLEVLRVRQQSPL